MSKSLQFLLLVLTAVIGVLVTQEAYRWVAFGEERERVRVLSAELSSAGAELLAVRAEIDSLRSVVEARDLRLREENEALQDYVRHARHGKLPLHLYERYREDLDRYNRHVVERNGRTAELEAVIAREHAAVARYNLLSDSIHALAVRMGKPYYSVPTPLEAAMERRETSAD